MVRTAVVVLALASCTAAAPAPAPSLAGQAWEILTIDGQPFEAALGEEPTPGRLTFAGYSYSAYAGCNAMGGLYAQRGNRLLTYPGPQTAMACFGRRGEQEGLVDLILRAGPRIAGTETRVTLSHNGRTLQLERTARRGPLIDPPAPWQGGALAGKRFSMHTIDGDSLNRRPAPELAFGHGTVAVRNLCGKSFTAAYKQDGGTVTFNGPNAGCLGGLFAKRSLSVVQGPNGELLLAGDDHWLAGDNLRRDRPK